jgi:ABC-2 type transport system permease protein
VDPALAASVADPPQLQRFVLEPSGVKAPADALRELRPFLVPVGFALLLVLSVFTSASYLATGLAEEKQNRTLELLLTSLTPDQLFWGKLLGLWGAALLQFLLYLVAVAMPAGLLFQSLELRLDQALVGFCYFVLGFFFFGAVLLMVGAIGNSHKYTQQLSAVFTFTAILPLIMVTSLLAHPDGRLARTLTYIPFTAPVTGLLRFGADALPGWEFALSLLVLSAGAALVVRSCARIFRVALLATGTTPTPGQLWQWLRRG